MTETPGKVLLAELRISEKDMLAYPEMDEFDPRNVRKPELILINELNRRRRLGSTATQNLSEQDIYGLDFVVNGETAEINTLVQPGDRVEVYGLAAAS